MDYLNTLTQRYPDSDRIEDTQDTVDRLIKKINAMIPTKQSKHKEPIAKANSTEKMIGTIIAAITALIIISLLYRER